MLSQDDIVKRLSDFGLTVNQAKVYISIVQSGPTSASKISEATHLHRQDIYKILPKLEKMGLIIETIAKPFTIKAIPVETALRHLVEIETKKTNERISHLKADLKEITEIVKEQQETGKSQEEERWIISLTTDAEIANTSHLTFEKARLEYDLVTNLELITRMADHMREHLQALSRKGARIRIIIENPNDENLLKETLEKIRPKRGNFAVKLIHKNRCIPYQIFDHRELWISMRKVTKSGLPCVLWTNGTNMIEFFEESFEESWNNQTVSIYTDRHAVQDSA